MFRKLFGRPAKSKPRKTNPRQRKTLSQYFIHEIQSSDLVRQECQIPLLRHLSGEFDLIKDGTALTAAEKKELGINARLKITRELLEVLTEEGRKQAHPASELASIKFRAEFAKSNDERFEEFQALGVKYVEVIAPQDDRTCAWCTSLDGKKLPINQDINQLIEDNCTCENHNRLALAPVV